MPARWSWTELRNTLTLKRMRNIFYKKMARQAVINTGVHKVSKRRGLLQKRNVASWLEAPPTNILNNVLFELHLSNTIRRGSGILPRFSRILKRPITQPLGIRNRLNAFLSAEVLVQGKASCELKTERTRSTRVFQFAGQHRPGPKDECSETSFSVFRQETSSTPQTIQSP
jgi:hypothetical protein